jgi:secreted PhoX family phosphatase
MQMNVKKALFGLLTLSLVLMIVPAATLAADDRLISLNDPMAAFLETRAYAAKMGATAEFRKMEGVAYDAVNNKLYIAMSAIEKTMTDGKGDINLPVNKCGIVYSADLDANYNMTKLVPAVVGGKYDKSVKSTVGSGFRDRCDVNMIANPDGLYTDPQGNLWISEDTKNHTNNALWRWDGKKLKRFATVPTGAEITGIHVTPDGTVLFNVQHPSAMSKFPYNRGVVGIVNGYNTSEDFKSVPVPSGDAILDVVVAKGEYQVLARVGEKIPNDPYGHSFGQVDKMDGSLKIMCNHPDGNMFLPINAAGTMAYLYTNYECRPGTIGKIYMEKDGKRWKVLDGENVNFDAVRGTWNNCNASVTPWNTGLSCEEYEPMAVKGGWKENVKDMTTYLGKQANPYDYGWLLELIPDQRGNIATTQVVKHYAMGRLSYEMGRVMPDMKTAYSGDDGTGVILAKFVADKAKDLSAGTLYAAKITQQADESLDIQWIELGRSNNADVFDAIRKVALK